MPMDPKNLSAEERMALQSAERMEHLSQLMYETRNKILRTAQNKVNALMVATPPADRPLIAQAAYEACVIMVLRYEEDLRAAGMPSLLIRQTHTQAEQMGIETMMEPQQGSGLILPVGGKDGS